MVSPGPGIDSIRGSSLTLAALPADHADKLLLSVSRGLLGCITFKDDVPGLRSWPQDDYTGKYQYVAQVVAAWLAETAGSNDTSADVNATLDGAGSAPSSEGGDSKPGSKDKAAGGKGSGKPPVHDSPSEFWDKMVRTRLEFSLCMTPSAVVPHTQSCLRAVNWQSCTLILMLS